MNGPGSVQIRPVRSSGADGSLKDPDGIAGVQEAVEQHGVQEAHELRAQGRDSNLSRLLIRRSVVRIHHPGPRCHSSKCETASGTAHGRYRHGQATREALAIRQYVGALVRDARAVLNDLQS